MSNNAYRYQFDPQLNIAEVEATFTLAVLASESLHGESRVRLEGRHGFNAVERTRTIFASNEVGQDLSRLFLGFLSREFGANTFSVEGVDTPSETIAA
jgi:hypothetical protein